MPSGYDVLYDLLTRVSYKAGWKFELRQESFSQDCPAMLMVRLRGADSVTGSMTMITHGFPLPTVLPPEAEAPALAQAWWQRWLLDRIIDIERHEACEFFTVDGAAPFFPRHGSARVYEVVLRKEPFPVQRPEGEHVVQMMMPGSSLQVGYARK